MLKRNAATTSSPWIRNLSRYALACLAGLLPLQAFAHERLSTADCDAPAFARTLHAGNGDLDAKAQTYWFNRQLIRWPGKTASGQFRLYHSATGQVHGSAGTRVSGADGSLLLEVQDTPLPDELQRRFSFVRAGVNLSVAQADMVKVDALLRQQLVLVNEDAEGRLLASTALQLPGALDDRYADARDLTDLGATPANRETRFRVWAPTAQALSVCLYDDDASPARQRIALERDARTGSWSLAQAADLSGSYYTYLADVFVRGVGVVRNRVTDPYSVSLGMDSQRSYIADLQSAALKPPGWDALPFPDRVKQQTDMMVYELHVRDFSINDASVPPAHRGKYLAFTDLESQGSRHLRALSDAGMTDVHLLPVFDFATVPERGCATPEVPAAAPDSDEQQAAVMAMAAGDCFNWGYDPYHFNAPEGSYASDAGDGARRIIEFRQMVMALHGMGLRVGMDVVYNHTTTSGQQRSAVLDRLVPGYYQRLDGDGVVERSTCCDNTATEHRMMGKLMIDSALLWAREYRIDSFRFDLMGHQPRAVMEALKQQVDAATGRDIQLIGEGWNFGEVADGARFVQASQLSLNGSGIGTFSDRTRDALRGGGPSDSGEALVSQQGWLNGLVYAPNARANPRRARTDLLKAADMIRVGLAGSLRDFVLLAWDGRPAPLAAIDYNGQPAGYASQPGEVVNYVENHDNQSLFDNNAYKLPQATSTEDRARVQMLGAAITAFSQGVAYFHAGIDTLRSKSMDRNSFDSGDWFNRLDWAYQDNYFGTGLPPRQDNAINYPLMRPLLADGAIRPLPQDIALARDMFRDLLAIRASSSLFRLPDAEAVKQRLGFPNSGRQQDPLVIVGHLQGGDGEHGLYPGAGFREILYLVNASPTVRTLQLPSEKGKHYVLHPRQASASAADQRPRMQARYQASDGRFSVPPRTAVVYVVEEAIH